MTIPNTNLNYFGIDKPTLPYRTNTSPIDDRPHFISGSVNALATVSGWVEKRAGFSGKVETVLSSVPGFIRRIWGWKRWSGSATNPDCFFIMLSTINGTSSQVYKLNLGNGSTISPDRSFSLLWTDSTTTTPFDFQDSNNFCFFGNASTQTNNRKYDGSVCSQWGVFAPISAPSFSLASGTLPAGLSFNTTTGVLSGTPTASGSVPITFTVTDAAAATSTQSVTLFTDPSGLEWTTTAGTLPPATVGSAYSFSFAVQSGTTPYTFSLFAGTPPAGLTLSSAGVLSGTPTTAATAPTAFAVQVTDHVGAIAVRSFTLFIGASGLTISPTSLSGTVGTAYSQVLTVSGTAGGFTWSTVGAVPAGLTFSQPSGVQTGLLAGTPAQAGVFSITFQVIDASTTKASQFVVSMTISATALTITNTSLPDAQVGVAYSQTIQVSGGTSPYTFSYTSGALTGQTGYFYGYTYTSMYGHESSMSPLSVTTGLFTDQDINVTVLASTDAQVTGINIYRTSDGGTADPGSMYLITSLTNAIHVYQDSTTDSFLGTQTGPSLYINDPPQPIKGLKWSNGRIWGFKNATTWFTGNEEVTNGIPVECMSDAKNGNYYSWPSEVYGIVTTGNGVDISLSLEWWQITGDTLATFSKDQLLRGGGTLSPTCSLVIGSTVYWLDTAKQLYSSAGEEIGESIRPDLAGIVPSQTFLVYHKFQKRNWLLVLDGANGRIIPYDLDMQIWGTPWTTTATCLASAQTSMTNISLMAAYSTGHVMQQTEATYLDDGAAYADQIRTNLFSIVSGAGKSNRNATAVRQTEQFEMEVNTYIATDGSGNQIGYVPLNPTNVYCLPDDNPLVRPLSGWLNLSDPTVFPDNPAPLQYDSQYNEHLNLLAQRWLCNTVAPARRIAFCSTWNAAQLGWIVYSFDLATRAT